MGEITQFSRNHKVLSSFQSKKTDQMVKPVYPKYFSFLGAYGLQPTSTNHSRIPNFQHDQHRHPHLFRHKKAGGTEAARLDNGVTGGCCSSTMWGPVPNGEFAKEACFFFHQKKEDPYNGSWRDPYNPAKPFGREQILLSMIWPGWFSRSSCTTPNLPIYLNHSSSSDMNHFSISAKSVPYNFVLLMVQKSQTTIWDV